jgi:tetratricopeptide (TPR) repeat protein
MRTTRNAILLAVGLMLAWLAPAPLTSQTTDTAPPATLVVTSSSAEAKSEFWAGLHDNRYFFFERAAQHLAKAVALDPDFGLARVLYGSVAVDYSDAQRQREYDAGVAAAAKATMGEALVALAWRDWSLGRPTAPALLRAATEVFPADGGLASDLATASTQNQGNDTVIAAFRALLAKFPDQVGANNTLAYTLWAAGDHAGALAAAQAQVQGASQDPNPHDTYAELLAWSGQLDEAAQHYQHALDADSMFSEALAGSAEVRQLQGRGAEARTLYAQAIAREPSRAARLNHQYSIAISYLYDGNRTLALSQLATVAQQAAADSNPFLAALAHRQMAVVEGMFGNAKAVAAHLAAAQGDGNRLAQDVFTTWAYGGARQLDSARAAADRVSQAAASGNANQRRTAHMLQGFVALQNNAAQQAMDELNQADTTSSLVQELRAESQKRLGNKAQAQALRTAVLSGSVWSLPDAIARMRARKM